MSLTKLASEGKPLFLDKGFDIFDVWIKILVFISYAHNALDAFTRYVFSDHHGLLGPFAYSKRPSVPRTLRLVFHTAL